MVEFSPVPLVVISIKLVADAWHVSLEMFSRSLSGDIIRILVKDGFTPERRETETRSVLLDMGLLPLNQST